MKQILQQIALTMEANSGHRAQNAGRKAAIVYGTTQSNIIYDALSNNLTVTDTANVVNLTVVHEECLRHGYRLAAINGGRVLKRKVTNRQRKHLLQMGPVHRHAQSALKLLLGHQTTAEAPLNDEEILEAILEEAGAILEIENVILEEHDDDEEIPAELNLENIDYLISSGSHGI